MHDADDPRDAPSTARRPAHGERGMVCAAQPDAVRAGLDVLKAGGSAVDAAIATNACLGVVEPTANGLGGDLFALVWDPGTATLHGLNGSGRAPLALTIDRVVPSPDGTIPLDAPSSWTVPGCADGWAELHARFGRLPFRDLLEPAARLADGGFAVTPVIASEWARGAERRGGQPGFREVYLPDGRAPRAGETFRNPALARTLRSLGAEGGGAFYEGAIADAVVRFSDACGGAFALDDFRRHRSTWDTPIASTYRGVTVWELPPNGQGLAALQILNLLEGFDVASMGRTSPEFWHLLIEAKKLAYADRARYYADPAFADVPVEALLSKDYAHARAATIDLARAATTDAPGEPLALRHGDTTYLCAADRDGMMVSLIQSNYTGFGSGHAVAECGFGLQNRGALFALDPRHPNALAPGKRPFHTIIPGFATRDGAPWLAFGVMGGDMQPQGHAQVLVNLLDFGVDLQAAGDAPRLHHGGSSEPTGTVMRDGGAVHLEPGFPEAVVTELERRGHRIEPAETPVFGGYQAIARDPSGGGYLGATERRKDGCSLGW